MRIKIDKYGALHIERAGTLKNQYCPFGNTDSTPCGDWCPHFLENYVDGSRSVRINLCHDTRLLCSASDFIDERK